MLRISIACGLVFFSATVADAIDGTVVDPDGNPVAGAEVFLVPGSSRSPEEESRQTRTGADGRFQIEAPQERTGRGRYLDVIAYKPGWAFGAAELRLPNDAQVSRTITLQPAIEKSFRITGPDGKPVAVERAWIAYFTDEGPGSYYVGRLGAEYADIEINRDGTGTFNRIPQARTFAVFVDTKQHGLQRAHFSGEGEKEYAIRLRPVGRLQGRVVAGDPEAIRDLTVTVSTRRAERPEGSPVVVGTAELQTDNSGRFDVPALAEGNATITVQTDNSRPFRSPGTVQATVEAGETAEVTIELVKAVRVTGTVVDDETSQPVEGAVISVHGQQAVTDKDGRFEGFAAPGRVYVSFRDAPGLYLEPLQEYRNVQAEAGTEEHELEPFRLKKGRELAGVVVNERDEPVARARVKATWQETDGRIYSLGGKAATSDEDGRFVLKPVPRDWEIGLTALTDERATPDTVKVQPGDRDEVRLKVLPEAAVTIEGRVVDVEGNPVAGAKVQVRGARKIPAGRVYGWSIVSFNGKRELTTGQDGMFRTPRKLARDNQYSLSVAAEGMLKHDTGYLTPASKGDPVRFEDIVLYRERSIEGRVVDSQGRPVAGATVWSHGHSGRRQGVQASGETGEDGRFRLEKLHPDARLLFVEKDGYRPSGAVIPKSDKSLEVTIRSKEAPPLEPLRSVRRSGKEQQRLLKELMLPLYPQLRESNSDYFPLEVVRRLAPYDLRFALGQLDNMKRDSSRVEILTLLGEYDDALAHAAGGKDPYGRAFRYFKVAEAVPDKTRRREILFDALVAARNVQRPDRRVALLGIIAERLYDLGDRETAERIVEEGREIAEELAPAEWSGYARGSFAERVALFDPKAAEKLIDILKEERAHTRHAGNIAHELADVDPAEAERFLKMIERDNNITPYAVRVCYRIAKADLPRARRIADALEGSRAEIHKAHVYGVMAMAVAEKDPQTARELLQKAFAQIEAAQSAYQRRSMFPVAVTLLRFSETVDPERTREYFWQALAVHPGPSGDYFSPSDWQERQDKNISRLVMLLGLYGRFPELQQELMDPVFKRWAGYENRQQLDFYRANEIFTAMALADPERAIRWQHAFQKKLSQQERRLIPQPWMTIADVFGRNGTALGKRISAEVFHLWVIDKEDL